MTLIPYYAGDAETMRRQAGTWAVICESEGYESPFALENVTMHAHRGEAYHETAEAAIQHLHWFKHQRFTKYQGLGVPVLDYEPSTDAGRSSWRWCADLDFLIESQAEAWLNLVFQYVESKVDAKAGVGWYNARRRIGPNSLVHITRISNANRIERYDDVTDIWCIDSLDVGGAEIEAFEESRKPIALWLHSANWDAVREAVRRLKG